MKVEPNKVKGDSKVIVTNQKGIHEKLADIVEKHLNHPFQKPFPHLPSNTSKPV